MRFRRALAGDKAAVLSPPSAAERAMAESDEYWSYLMAAAYALAGETDQALSWLDAYGRCAGVGRLRVLHPARSFPREHSPDPTLSDADGLGEGAVRAVHRRWDAYGAHLRAAIGYRLSACITAPTARNGFDQRRGRRQNEDMVRAHAYNPTGHPKSVALVASQLLHAPEISHAHYLTRSAD